MKRILLLLIPLSMMFAGCAERSTNPFFADSYNTPFEVPPFDKIDDEHFLPAVEEGIKRHQAEIDAIVNNPESPTFDNTIVAYDEAGEMLSRVNTVFGGLRSAETNPRLQEIARETTPMLSAHSNSIRMNQDLFARIAAVYEQREEMGLDLEQMRVVEMYYRDFERSGAALPEAERERLAGLSERMSMISLQLGENMLAETNAFQLRLETEEDLAGLPESVRSSAADAAKSAGVDALGIVTLHNPSWIPFLMHSTRRDLREKVFTAYFMRGDNDNDHDNKDLFSELMQLRQEMAKLLGYNNYAEFFQAIQMSEHPGNVYDFLYEIWEPSLARAKSERAQMQRIVNREGGDFQLEPWDWWFYAEKLRKELYDLDDSELRPFFPIDRVRDGNFLLANKLFGLTFEYRPEVPVYHDEVEAFEVFDRDGSHLGILFIDPHPRPGKRGGAWCGTYRSGSYRNGEKIYPIVTMVMNFSRPSGDRPALLTFDETTTYYHEFGHALHNFFADGRYSRTSRSVPRDFVELPSQILENWAAHPDFLNQYALHFETGQPMPEELQERLLNSQLFNQGFAMTEYLAAAILDMDWHTTEHGDEIDVRAFEETSLDRIGLIDEIKPRYRTTYFNHIFGTGYAAGYYVYRWAGVLDADAFQAFVDSGDLYNQELAERFRKYILAENALRDGMEAYLEFRGQEPDITPFLSRYGLN